MFFKVLLLLTCQVGLALATTEQEHHAQPTIAASHLELSLAEALENPQREPDNAKKGKRTGDKPMVEEEVIGFKVVCFPFSFCHVFRLGTFAWMECTAGL
ncbi:signal peptide containing protein [Theileria equi strain WA]|uniref:Signal peptide containing protein n=1 Tax=Theileria equi strain WA TaxID=1537102 RepID=L1LG55_THEEQ|nr:signal peptide containing protein [Theileria equi strain WA]EKX74138.1 signal peptide containing protein [Theileria equi strain WA]|eukprot:XP_004833590.1 signal peptide containing protein [Theileria equi strain WA]